MNVFGPTVSCNILSPPPPPPASPEQRGMKWERGYWGEGNDYKLSLGIIIVIIVN